MDQVRDEQHKKTRQRVPARTPAPASAERRASGPDEGEREDAETAPRPDGEASDAPRKRRRRRKPRSGGAEQAGSVAAAE